MRSSTLILVVALVCAASTNVSAEPFFQRRSNISDQGSDALSIEAFGETIAIPTPAHFVSSDLLGEQKKEVDAVIDSMKMEQSRIALIFLQEATVGKILSGAVLDLDRFATVRISRNRSDATIDSSGFRKFAASVREFSSFAIQAMMKDLKITIDIPELEKAGVDPSSLRELSEKISKLKAVPLGVYEETPDSICMAAFTALPSSDVRSGNGVRVSATSTVLVNRRMVMLDVHTPFQSERDLKWVRITCSEWTKDILRANNRLRIPASPSPSGSPLNNRSSTAPPDRAGSQERTPNAITKEGSDWGSQIVRWLTIAAGIGVASAILRRRNAKPMRDESRVTK